MDCEECSGTLPAPMFLASDDTALRLAECRGSSLVKLAVIAVVVSVGRSLKLQANGLTWSEVQFPKASTGR